jgi:putative ABC transport system ATP-binding protein
MNQIQHDLRQRRRIDARQVQPQADFGSGTAKKSCDTGVMGLPSGQFIGEDGPGRLRTALGRWRRGMSEKLTTFAWRNSKHDQLALLFLTLLTFPLIWATLELPKIVINDAIQGLDFPREIYGIELEQIPYLFSLCGLYLLVIAVNNALKFYLNFKRGIAGERILRRARFDLFQRVMARPLARLKTTSTGELVQIISAELAPIGDFIGAIISTPVAQGGSFLVYLTFIMVQNPLIGAAALALYPVQAWLIPKLQAKVIGMIRARLANIRAMAREINESIEGAEEIRSLRTRRWHMAVVSRQLYDNYVIRRRIFILKFLIKFVNNVAGHLTPFFIFLIGGYFVIEGRLDLGALTAVLIAYKDLASPWKELLSYYQNFSDMSARWDNIMEQFAQDDAPGPLPAEAPVGEHAVALNGAQVEGLRGKVTCFVPRGKITAVVAEDASHRTALIQALSGMQDLDHGRWTAGTRVLYRACVLVRGDARIYAGDMRQNLVQGLQFRPVSPADDPAADARRVEALLTGAPTDDVNDDWIDPREAGYDDHAAVDRRMLALATRLGLEDDIYTIGLGSRATEQGAAQLTSAVLELRKRIAASAELGEMRADFIDVWAEDGYVPNATVAENLFFARPADPEKCWADYAGDPEVQRALDHVGARDLLVEVGVDLCGSLLSLFEGVGGDSELVKQYGLFPKSETQYIETIVRKAKARGVKRLNRAETTRMLQLAFAYNSARFRLSIVQRGERLEQLLKARKALRKFIERDPRFERFDDTRWMGSFTLAENLFFGPVRLDRRGSWGPFKSRIDTLVEETGLRQDVLRAGLSQPLDGGAVTLNAHQRRRVGLARALMKNPCALAIDGIAASDGPGDKALRKVLAEELAAQPVDDIGAGALIYGASSVEAAEGADHVIWVTSGGRQVGEGDQEAFASVDWNEIRGR